MARTVPNLLSAPQLLEAFTLYDKGATIKEVVDYFREKGILGKRGKPIKFGVVTRLSKNRRYIGEYRYRDIVTEDAIPAIVPKDLFDRVQERMEKNKKAPARKKARDEEYLLTTKLFCGMCGAAMVGESGTSHTDKIHRYYKCANVKKKKCCHKKTVRKDEIEKLVLDATMRLVFDDEAMELLADKLVAFQQQEDTHLPLLKRQLEDTSKGIDNLLNAIQQGILTVSTKARLEQLEKTKAQIEVSILQAEIEKPLISREQILFWLHRFRKTDITNPEERQRLVDSFVNAIYLYDDKIVLTFNYKDGTKTITLNEIEVRIWMRVLSETDADELDRKLVLLADRLAEKDRPRITVVRFIPDDRKTGGRYEELSGVVKKLDLVMRCIVFYGPNGITDGQVIDLDRIADISGELFRGMDDGSLLP